MKQTRTFKFVAMLLCMVMLIGILSFSGISAFAVSYSPREDDCYKVVSKQDWELAPGVTESEIVLNNVAGSCRQVAHVVETDLSNEYTKVIPSYKGMAESLNAKDYGVQVMSEQAAYAEANGYGNVVAAMNLSLSWYNTTYYNAHPELVGEPLGYMILDGVQYTNSQGKTSGAQTCVVINFDEKDGTTRPDTIDKVQIRSTSDPITGWEEQVIPANFGFLVKDGVNQYSKDHAEANSASRSFVGVKADGTFVMVMNDGRQAPYSTGFTNYEMAEFMLSLGCVVAANGDGGGSSTFLSQRPGEELALNCAPSDGAERPTTHGILVISTAPATGEFVRATITAENDYYTPGSTVKFTAIGSDLVGTKADIPSDVTWKLKDDTMGSIENGVFVSNGKTGTATAQMVYNGAVVGEASVEIVIPTEFSFAQSVMTVPFGKEVTISFNATINNGVNKVTLKPSDVNLTTTNSGLGTFNGFQFTAVDEDDAPANIKSTVTATLVHNENLTTIASLNLGKGSEVLYDFENQSDMDSYYCGDVNGDTDGTYKVSHATAENGQVHDGNGSLRVELDPISSKNNNDSYCQPAVYFENGTVIENAKSIGFWLYIPDEFANCWLRVRYYVDANNDGIFETRNIVSPLQSPEVYDNWDESGWKYFSVDVSAYSKVLIPGKDSKTLMGNYYSASSCDALNFRFIEFNMPHTNASDLWKTYGTINALRTLYLDNITVDYSDAVDDREAPIFGDVVLAGNDNGTKLTKHTVAKTTDNSLTISAVVAEDTTKTNATGLDIASAKAYIDGVAVDVSYANGRMTISNVAVADGVHRVKFEICDNMGNKSVVIRLVKVESGVDASTVQVVPDDTTLDRLYGGSVYWMNINANKIETIKSVKAVIDLNAANHWELDHMVLAKGFTATYTIDKENNTATIIITRTGSNSDTGAATLASLPIRVTYYDTDIKINGMTAEQYWNNYAFWPYDLKVDVDMGEITYVEGYTSNVLNAFSNEEFSVDLEEYTVPSAMDSAFKAERGTAHVHTETALPNLDATCTEDGYTGRTYCEVCRSVVKWGTTIPATDHTEKVVDGKLECECGHQFTTTGLINIDGKNYYAINGELTGGWISINNDWYFFDKTTFEGFDGQKIPDADHGIKYVFDNGRVTNGVWYTNSVGTRYWYGPSYYKDQTNDLKSSIPVEIDGKTYLFNRKGYMQTGVVYRYNALTVGSESDRKVYYNCGEDGVASLLQGVYNDYFYVNGMQQKCYQLVAFEGNYYFINDGHKLAKNKSIYLSAKFLEGTDFVPGVFTFDADGKMELKNGPQEDGKFYINNVLQKCYQLVEYEGNYYFINDGHKIAKDKSIYLSAKFLEGTDFVPGVFTFDANGKMVIKNGPQEDGKFYINNVLQKCYQLVEYEGNYYFVNDGHKIAKDKSIYLSAKFLEGTDFVPGVFTFDANGKMVIKNGPQEDGKFYINNVLQKCYQLVEYEGNYYFINDGHKIAKDKSIYLSAKFLEGTDLPVGHYYFDANGKMVIKNGPQEDGKFYINNVLQKCYQLVEYEGNYYFVNDGHKIAKDKSIYLSAKFLEGTDLPVGHYYFDADGKMELKNGPQEDGTFYLNGVQKKCYQLVEYEGNYYFVNDGHKIAKDKSIYLSDKFLTDTTLTAGLYYFDVDGKMILN